MVLIACEESQIVCSAFRMRGIEAFSCDILPTRGDRPDWHIQKDLREMLWIKWDAIIAFPPCTHLAVSGAKHFAEKRRDGRQQVAIDFFMNIVNAKCDKIAVENPVGIMSTIYCKPTQIIQPWQFGHGETKKTCLWLKNLPPLTATNVVQGRCPRVHRMPPSPERARLRSQTYSGIADAMAEQWSHLF